MHSKPFYQEYHVTLHAIKAQKLINGTYITISKHNYQRNTG